MNPYAQAMIAFGRSQKKAGKQYKYGAHGPDKFDCVGLVLAAVRAAGLDKSVYPVFWNVRHMVEWGSATGALHTGTLDIQRGDIFLWGDAKSADHKPASGAGHTGLCLQPPSIKHPRGKAISAYNPDKDIIVHDLLPANGGHLAFYGYLRLPSPAPEPAQPPADEQPEPPAPSGEAAEQPDDAPTVDELQAKIDAAKAALS